jgi:hypothetical protein
VDPSVSERPGSLLPGNTDTHVHITTGDGRLGWPTSGPYAIASLPCVLSTPHHNPLDQSRSDSICANLLLNCMLPSLVTRSHLA